MVAQETLDGLEKTLDVIEDQLDTLERIPKVHLNGTTKGQQILILGATAAVSAAVGSAVTYRIVRNKLKLRYEALAAEEVAEARRFYGSLHKTDDSVATPEAARKTLIGEDEEPKDELPSLDEVIQDLNYRSDLDSQKPVEAEPEDAAELDDVEERVVRTEKVVERTVSNVFDNARSDFHWDQDIEESKRDRTQPYVISADEYLENEPDHEQITLVYHDGGSEGVLCDEHDIMIDKVDRIVGEYNLNRFGHGSGDANVVYVRNEREGADYEIARTDYSYAKDIAGFREDDERSERPLRFRDRE